MEFHATSTVKKCQCEKLLYSYVGKAGSKSVYTPFGIPFIKTKLVY